MIKQLLAPEIRRERNTVLQCIRHIVKKNFFGIEGSVSNTEPSIKTNDCDVSPEICTNGEQSETSSGTKSEHQISCSSDTIVDHVCIN